MPESSERSKPPVRIVYHAENKTFARLFNERSLEDIKDVVRRKLGLGKDTTVSLKQMGADALLDLEDDDDFKAFCVFLTSSVSVDIQVTLGKSQGPAVPPPVVPPPREPTSENKSDSEDEANASSTSPSESSESPAPALASPPPIRRRAQPKRKASQDDGPPAKTRRVLAPSPKHPQKPTRLPKPGVGRKEKGVHPADVVETPQASAAPKPVAKAPAALEGGHEVVTKMPKDATTSQPPAKKRKQEKKDDSTGPQELPASVMAEYLENYRLLEARQSKSQPGSAVAPHLASGNAGGSTVRGSTSRTQKSKVEPKITACSTVPRTNASESVELHVAAAILSGIRPPPSEAKPAKRRYVRKNVKKSTTSLPAESISAVITPSVKEAPNVPTEQAPENVVPTSGSPQQIPEQNDHACPICLEVPFHIRYCCPTVLKGPDAIRGRLEELKRTDTDDQQLLIKELEGLLRDSKVTSKLSLDAVPANSTRSSGVSPEPNAALSRIPNIPTHSHLSEVTVESRNEGSSSDSSDDMSAGRVEPKEPPAARGQQMLDEQPSRTNDELEAVIRGPTSKWQSVLDRIAGDEDDEDSDSKDGGVDLEADRKNGRMGRRDSSDSESGVEDGENSDSKNGEADLEADRRLEAYRRNGRMGCRDSSDSESGAEESRSPSPSRPVEGSLGNNLTPRLRDSNRPLEESPKHQDGDIVMNAPVNPPAPERQGDGSSEETHVGTEDRVVMDESSGGKGAAATEQVSIPPVRRASVVPPSDASDNELQGPTAIDADPIENAEGLEPDVDRIEALSEDNSFFRLTQSTPRPGVTRRIKTRSGQIPRNEAESPVLLAQLALGAPEDVNALPTRGKDTQTPTSQDVAPTLKSPRLDSLPSFTSTPAAVALLNHRAKLGAGGKASKSPAKQTEERSDASKSSVKDDITQNKAPLAQTPSMVRWEALTEPESSPSILPDEPSMHMDELSSSPPHNGSPRGQQSDKGKKGPPRKLVFSTPAESNGKQRLFDLTSSQIPFPYSQYQTPAMLPNEDAEMTDSEEELKASKKKAKQAQLPARYRSLSQLASQATLFSPSLPMLANKSAANKKANQHVTEEDSPSSSSSDADEANGSEHIPRGRRAGSVLESKRKKKGLLSGM